MNELNGEDKEQFREALLSAFPELEDLKRILEDKNYGNWFKQIKTDESDENILRNLINKIESDGKTPTFLDIVFTEKPKNAKLGKFFFKYNDLTLQYRNFINLAEILNKLDSSDRADIILDCASALFSKELPRKDSINLTENILVDLIQNDFIDNQKTPKIVSFIQNILNREKIRGIQRIKDQLSNWLQSNDYYHYFVTNKEPYVMSILVTPQTKTTNRKQFRLEAKLYSPNTKFVQDIGLKENCTWKNITEEIWNFLHECSIPNNLEHQIIVELCFLLNELTEYFLKPPLEASKEFIFDPYNEVKGYMPQSYPFIIRFVRCECRELEIPLKTNWDKLHQIDNESNYLKRIEVPGDDNIDIEVNTLIIDLFCELTKVNNSRKIKGDFRKILSDILKKGIPLCILQKKHKEAKNICPSAEYFLKRELEQEEDSYLYKALFDCSNDNSFNQIKNLLKTRFKLDNDYVKCVLYDNPYRIHRPTDLSV